MSNFNLKAFRVLLAVLLSFGLQQLSLGVIAAEESTSATITVYKDARDPSFSGGVTPSMINTTVKLASYLDKAFDKENGSEGVCTENSGSLICNIASTKNVELNMTCSEEAPGKSLACHIGGPERPLYSIGCGLNDKESEASCTIRQDAGEAKRLIDGLGIANGNVNRLANTFMSCLQGSFGSAEASCGELASALNADDKNRAIDILNALAPLNPEVTSDLARDNLRNSTSVVLSRLGQIRTDTTIASNVRSQMFLANNEWLHAGTRLAANDSLASDVTPGTISTSISDFGKLGFFINVNATDGKYKNGSLSSSSDFTSTMLTLGFDYRVRDDLVTGLAFNLGQSKTKYKSTVKGELQADNYSFIVYNSFYKHNWYFDSSLTIGGDTYNQKRDPLGINNSFDAEYHSMQYSLSFAVGYDFYVQGFGLTPFMQLDVGQLHIDGYTEKEKQLNCIGNCGVALAMDKQKRDIGSFNVGGRFRYIFTTSKGVFIPNLTLTAVSDFKNDAQVVTGRFIGLNRASGFEIMSEKSDSDYFIVATGFSMQLKNGNSGFFNLESLQGYDNLDQMRVTLGWRWEL